MKKNLLILGAIVLVILAVFGASKLFPSSAPVQTATEELSLTTETPTDEPTEAAAEAPTTAPTDVAAEASTTEPTEAAAEAPTTAPTDVAAEASAATTELPDATEAGVEVTAPNGEAVVSATDAPAKAYLVVTVNNQVYKPLALTQEGDYTVYQKSIEATNIIHVTASSAAMSSSTCEGQDCVNQGTVSLENKAERILGNMIICLPNNVVLQLYNADEIADYIASVEASGVAQ